MRRVLKAELYKMYYRFDNLGFMIVGSILTLLFSMGVALYAAESEVMQFDMAFAIHAVSYSFYGMIIYMLVLQICLIGRSLQSKTIYYELMQGHKMESILFGRLAVISVAASLVLSGVMATYLSIEAWIFGFPVGMVLTGFMKNLFGMFLVILHFAMVTAMYVFIVKNDMLAFGLGIVTQFVIIPKIIAFCQANLSNQNVQLEQFRLWLGMEQIRKIWSTGTDGPLVGRILLSMVIEVLIAYGMVKLTNRNGMGEYHH